MIEMICTSVALTGDRRHPPSPPPSHVLLTAQLLFVFTEEARDNPQTDREVQRREMIQ